MVPGRIARVSSPRAAVIFDVDADVLARDDCGPDDESPARQARIAVQGSVGGQLGGAEDHVVRYGAVVQ
jgi:hypothetical protein